MGERTAFPPELLEAYFAHPWHPIQEGLLLQAHLCDGYAYGRHDASLLRQTAWSLGGDVSANVLEVDRWLERRSGDEASGAVPRG